MNENFYFTKSLFIRSKADTRLRRIGSFGPGRFSNNFKWENLYKCGHSEAGTCLRQTDFLTHRVKINLFKVDKPILSGLKNN